MTNETISGETVTKKRRRKIHFILVISVIIGVFSGVVYGADYQNIPLWAVIGLTVFILALTVYYYSLRDEYEKMRDFKHMSYGVFLAVGIVVPWYFASLKGLLPMPHLFITFLIICIPTYAMTIIGWLQNLQKNEAI